MINKIIVVDDESTVRNFLAALLTNEGYQVITATDGLDALEKINKQPPDLVITDLAMPNCDGIDLIRTLRKSPEYQALPVIMLSGSGSDNLTSAKNAGANVTLQKPVNAVSLIECVESLIANSNPT